jgi:hypothetical protein
VVPRGHGETYRRDIGSSPTSGTLFFCVFVASKDLKAIPLRGSWIFAIKIHSADTLTSHKHSEFKRNSTPEIVWSIYYWTDSSITDIPISETLADRYCIRNMNSNHCLDSEYLINNFQHLSTRLTVTTKYCSELKKRAEINNSRNWRFYETILLPRGLNEPRDMTDEWDLWRYRRDKHKCENIRLKRWQESNGEKQRRNRKEIRRQSPETQLVLTPPAIENEWNEIRNWNEWTNAEKDVLKDAEIWKLRMTRIFGEMQKICLCVNMSV